MFRFFVFILIVDVFFSTFVGAGIAVFVGFSSRFLFTPFIFHSSGRAAISLKQIEQYEKK